MQRDPRALVHRVRPAEPLVLELDLTEPLLIEPPRDPLTAARSRRRPRLDDIIDGLRRAETDPDVHAVIVKLGGSPFGMALAQELREVFVRFSRTGKPVVAWAETFGEFGPGSVGYYLASACDEVWIQESGDLCLTGVGTVATFLRDALDRAGIDVELGQRYEYKNAANTFTEQSMTPAHREAVTRLVTSIAEQLVDGVAAGRSLAPERVRELIDQSPLSAGDAHGAGLVDHVGYRDEVYEAVRRRVGGTMRLRFVGRYRHSATAALSNRVAGRAGAKVALIYGTGGIRVGRSGRSPLGGTSMGSNTVSAAFRSAVADADVKAIVFRVDSRGGSYVASDTIRREVVLARRAGKPVVVSMGEVAGSGGYFVAMAADTVLAQPTTLTGSIGVFGGKAVLDGLLSRIGIGTDPVADGANALMFSARRRYDESQLALLERWLDRVYDDFTAKVAADRGLSREHVHDVARGRVWTGADAREHRLIDDFGGLSAAVELARRRAGLAPRDDTVDVRVFPHVSPVDRLRPAQSSEDPSAAAVRLEAWGRFSDLAAGIGLPAAGPLVMPTGWPI
jgi:protease IV